MTMANNVPAASGWPAVPFEKVAITQSDRGQRLKQRAYLAEGAIPVVDQGQALVGGYTDDEGAAFVGDLPVVLFGDHTRAVKLIHHRFAVGADGIKIFRPAEGVRATYLYYWMKSARIPDRGYGRHYQYLRALSVPLPPAEVQDEIVAEIEKQFSRLDEAVANLQRVKANLKRYKASVLNDAVEGRLVEGDYQSEMVKLGSVANVVDPQPSHRTPPTHADGVPYIGIGDVLENGKVDLQNSRKVSPTVLAEHRARYTLRMGDFIFGKIGTLGKPTLLLPPYDYTLSANVVLVQADGVRLLPEYALIFMERPKLVNMVNRDAKATTQAAYGIKRMRDLDIELPTIEVQRQIISEVDRRLSLLRSVEAEVESNLKRAQALRHSVLSKSFVGP